MVLPVAKTSLKANTQRILEQTIIMITRPIGGRCSASNSFVTCLSTGLTGAFVADSFFTMVAAAFFAVFDLPMMSYFDWSDKSVVVVVAGFCDECNFENQVDRRSQKEFKSRQALDS